MIKKILIIDNASTLAMRVKLLLELQNCAVVLINVSELDDGPLDDYFDLIVFEFSMSLRLVANLKSFYPLSTFLVLSPSPDTLVSQKPLLMVQKIIPEVLPIYAFFTNKEIIDQLDNLLQLTSQADSLCLPKILLVDDNPERLSVLKAILLGASLDIRTMNNAKEVTDAGKGLDEVDILICDFHLGNCTGIDVFREVKQQFKDCQCILLTSRDHHVELIDVIRIGVGEVLKKPVNEHILLQSIHKLWQTELLKHNNQNLMSRLQETLDVLVERDILLRVLYNSSPDGIMVVEESGKILESNQACQRMFDYDKTKLTKLHFSQFLTAESGRLFNQQLNGAKDEQGFSLELKGISRGKAIVPLSVSFRPINYYGQRVYAGTIRNISRFVDQRDILEQQKELLETKVALRTKALEDAKNVAEQASQSKSAFLANMSHELRTPMHSILSFARFGFDMINSGKIKTAKLGKYYDRIITSGDRLLKLLNNLLDLSKLDAGKFPFMPTMAAVDMAVNNVVQEIVGLADEKQIDVHVENSAVDAVIWCDSELLQQVIRNLLSNAIRFSHHQGLVIVTIADAYLKVEQVAVRALELTVCDQGVGIPESELSVIFDKFAQSSKTNRGAGGTGLGLAICKDFVGLHHGMIFAVNNPGGGATFTVKLPIRPPQ